MNYAQRNRIGIASVEFTSAAGTLYTIGDSVGTVQELTDIVSTPGRVVQLDAINLRDTAGQGKACRILFFSGSAPTLVDNDAFAWGASLPGLVGFIDIVENDYVTLDSESLVSRAFVGVRMKLADDETSLFAACVTAGAPTYGIGGKLQVDFHFSD